VSFSWKARDAIVSVIPRAQGSTAAGRALGTLRSRLASVSGRPGGVLLVSAVLAPKGAIVSDPLTSP
jgi:hypothetical protein